MLTGYIEIVPRSDGSIPCRKHSDAKRAAIIHEARASPHRKRTRANSRYLAEVARKYECSVAYINELLRGKYQQGGSK